jgi:hypothetical protein
VPHHSPIRQAYERDTLALERAAAAERTAKLRHERAERTAAAAADRAGPQLGRATALAEAQAASERSTVARRARDERLAAIANWPTPTQPGSSDINR